MNKNNKYKLGVLGGTFDPAHIGHIKISKEAKERFNLKEVIWAVTKKNPFKNKSSLSLKDRIRFAKKLSLKNKFIKINFFENKIKSNKTINLISYIKGKNSMLDLYFIMGADNLINFHRWHKWKLISQKCNILVFDRQGYKTKSLKSITFKRLNQKSLEFIKFKKVNISSSQLRKI